MRFKHIFFDLDCTLWDFESNSTAVLNELFVKYELGSKGLLKDGFIKSYQVINHKLWEDYGKGLIDKETLRALRFHKALEEHGLDDEQLSLKFGEDYILESPKRKALFPFTEEVLNYLHKKYKLHIITNGFEDSQNKKLANTGIKRYFKEIITSERAESKKPQPQIFEYALKVAKAKKGESVMIGDNFEVDIAGAQNLKIRGIFFNPKKDIHNHKPDFEISCLSELKKIL